MPQINILSSKKVFPRTASSTPPTSYLRDFEQAISSFVQAWDDYRPDDALSPARKQDLEWLKSTLRDYQMKIHASSNSCEFWKGFREGKSSRRMLPEQTAKSLVQILLRALTATKSQQIYELGVEVGWRYARLKDYLRRIRKQRRLEVAQQCQDYQRISRLIRPKDKTDDTDSLLSFGWMRERKLENSPTSPKQVEVGECGE